MENISKPEQDLATALWKKADKQYEELKRKISLRKKCNFIIQETIRLCSSLYPELRFNQILWNLNIVYKDTPENCFRTCCNFEEESYDTIIRMRPEIDKLLINKSDKASERLMQAIIEKGLKEIC